MSAIAGGNDSLSTTILQKATIKMIFFVNFLQYIKSQSSLYQCFAVIPLQTFTNIKTHILNFFLFTAAKYYAKG
jgi:hypothetical protein